MAEKQREIDVSRIDGVTGTFSLDSSEIICVPRKKHSAVDLCLKGPMYVVFADIQLFSSLRYKDAAATYDDAVLLGKEIERRYNECGQLRQGITRLKLVLSELLGRWGTTTDQTDEDRRLYQKAIDAIALPEGA